MGWVIGPKGWGATPSKPKIAMFTVIPGTESPGSCGFFIYFRPAKNTKFCGSHLPRARYVPHQFLRFVITCDHPFFPSPIFAPQRRPSKIQGNTLISLIDSSTVSIGGSTDGRHIDNHTRRRSPARTSPPVRSRWPLCLQHPLVICILNLLNSGVVQEESRGQFAVLQVSNTHSTWMSEAIGWSQVGFALRSLLSAGSA